MNLKGEVNIEYKNDQLLFKSENTSFEYKDYIINSISYIAKYRNKKILFESKNTSLIYENYIIDSLSYILEYNKNTINTKIQNCDKICIIRITTNKLSYIIC